MTTVRHATANAATLAWVALVAATVVSTLVGHDHTTGSAIGTVVLGVAAVKAWLVGQYFMELRYAPIALRLAFGSYCVLAWAVLSGLYLWA